ncbi:ATP-binding protein [Fervidicoccus fontis]|uniref:ATP-binding protein n=1 Tax=Fervidicoccus fontis (strain DSM 19380 / JCM 18336 / VKM B-2539 / Kam940) TaxID=1163730 RepID=H9ZZ63_FERFK|nr:ATP-binding protein [Fervidicoccus fontis]AFH42020.1 ATP-binding protein [Fervidicoccus fontis Kam940]
MGKSPETILLTGRLVAAVKLNKGKEFEETADVLRKLGAEEIIAGDVYVEDHLKYMERLGEEVGAKLVESLWGIDPEELLHEEIASGIRTLVVGCEYSMSNWLGREISSESVENFLRDAKRGGSTTLSSSPDQCTEPRFHIQNPWLRITTVTKF